MSTDLPASVVSAAQFLPMEDVGLHVLRTLIPDVPIFSLIPDDAPHTFILVRREYGVGLWGGRHGLLDEGRVRVECFTSDPDGDAKGAVLSEAVRVAFQKAGDEEMPLPNGDWIKSAQMTSEPSRRSDWATATGPVQYADLPTGLNRYECKFRLVVRKRPSTTS